MKKLLIGLYLLFLVPVTASGMFWPTEQDRPFTGLPPIITDIYRPPVNPLRRTPEEVCCSSKTSCGCNISRKDIIKQTRSMRANKRNGNCCTISPKNA